MTLEVCSGFCHACFNSLARNLYIFPLNIKSDEGADSTLLRSDSRMSDADKRIQHHEFRTVSVHLDAVDCQLYWKGGRVGSLFRAVHDCFVWNKPVISTTTPIPAIRMRPSFQ